MWPRPEHCVVDMDSVDLLGVDDLGLPDDLLFGDLDVDCPIPPDSDVLQQFPHDLEIPMLLDDPPSYSTDDPCRNYVLDPILCGLEDAAEWGPDAFPNLRPANEDGASMLLDNIKEEIKVEPDFPPSPPPSSAGSTSSLCSTELWPGEGASATQGEAKRIPEVPPLSPPFADNSPPESPEVISEIISSYTSARTPMSPSPNGSEALLKIIPCGLKLKASKQVTVAQRPAPFIKPKPIVEQPLAEINSNPSIKAAAALTAKTVALPSTIPCTGDKRKTIVLSAKDFAALTQKVRGNQSTCTIGVLNGTKTVPTTLRLQTQPPTKCAPPPAVPAPASPPMALASPAQPSVPTFAQVLTPSSAPAKVPLIPCQTISNSLPAVASIPVTATAAARPLQSSAFSMAKTSANPVKREMEMKALKRQQRMIKNRESACLSRKKKKEYVSSLEGKLSELEQENVQLKMENEVLKERLSEFENAMSWTKSPTFSVKTKKATAILAVLLMVSLNFGSFSTMVNRNNEPLAMGDFDVEGRGSPGSVSRHGRSLLWAHTVDVSPNNSTGAEFISRNSTGSGSVQPICPLFINQTESIRLDSELRRWIGSDPDQPYNSTPQEPLKPKPFNSSRQAAHNELSPSYQDQSLGAGSNLPFVPSALPKRTKLRRKSLSNRASKKTPSASNEVEVYGVRPPLYDYTAFLDSFHRRDDTFYVVSFSGDHILLPAQAHNTSSRPKMSLVLPAVPINKSMFGPNHIRMMQVDCEVTNTQMLRVRQDDIPAHVRPSDVRQSSFDRFVNTSTENGNTAVNDSSPSNTPSGNIATSRPSKASPSFHNSSGTEPNSPLPAQPSYRPYFVKDSYPERLALSPSQIEKLNTAFLKSKKVNPQSNDSNRSFTVQRKPSNDYP